MGSDNLGERKGCANIGEERARRKGAVDPGQRSGALRRVQFIDVDEFQRDRVTQQEKQRNCGLCSSRAIDDDSAAGAQHLRNELSIRGDVELDDGVDAVVAGYGHHPLADIFSLVIDHIGQPLRRALLRPFWVN